MPGIRNAGLAETQHPWARSSRYLGSGLSVLAADHSAQADACRGEIVFGFGETLAKPLVLSAEVGNLCDQCLVRVGQFVDPGGEVLGRELVELVPESALHGVAETVAFGA
jgi:hypothetical protein